MDKRKMQIETVDKVENLKDSSDEMFLLETDTMHIRQWHKAEDGKGHPSELFMCLRLEGAGDDFNPVFVLRITSREAANAMIGALLANAEQVWPSG